MFGGAGGLFVVQDAGEVGRGDETVPEALPDKLHRSRRRMHQILGKEPVIPQLIQYDLIRREIFCAGGGKRSRNWFSGKPVRKIIPVRPVWKTPPAGKDFLDGKV